MTKSDNAFELSKSHIPPPPRPSKIKFYLSVKLHQGLGVDLVKLYAPVETIISSHLVDKLVRVNLGLLVPVETRVNTRDMD